jgi:ketosteroid isomerase-like protein
MDRTAERRAQVVVALGRINEAWLKGTPDAINDIVDDEIAMVFPGFIGRVNGRESFVAGFRDFCENARVHSHSETDYQIDLVGNTAVATFRFDMIYERDGARYHSTGRDFWVFEDHASGWVAVWRTMLDMTEEPVN